MDLVMIRPPGIESGAFVVFPDSNWFSLVLLFFSATANTDTGLNSFDCAQVLMHETYDNKANCDYGHYLHYTHYCCDCIYCFKYCNYFDFHYLLFNRMVGVDRLSDCMQARPQDACYLYHLDSKHSGKIACPCKRHGDHSTPPLQRLSQHTWLQQPGIGRWIPDVVCQLAGMGMVPGYVMKRKGVLCVMPHTSRERPNVNVTVLQQRCHHFWPKVSYIWNPTHLA